MENNMEIDIIGRPSTVRAYKSLYNKWISPYYAGATSPSPDLILMSLLQDMKELSPRTQKIVLRLFKLKLIKDGHNIDKVIKAMRYLGRFKQQEKVQSLTLPEAKKLMKITKEVYPDFYPTMMLGLHAGMRRGEVFGLKWSDVDFINGNITVQRSRNGPTKNGSSRIVPISKDLEFALMGIYRVGTSDENNLFKEFNPNPILEDICSKSKVKHITFHGLRHTFATLALEAGVSPKDVQRMLGHTTLTMTLNTYWNIINDKPNLSFLPGL